MKTCKKIAALLLSLVMCMSLCVAAFADTEESALTITVKSTVVGETYEAYQVFSGTLSENGKTLSDIQWGAGVTDTEDLLAALNKIEAFEDCKNAADVADALTESNLSSFVAVVGQYLSTNADGSAKATSTESTAITVSAVGYYYVTTTLGSIVSVGLNSSTVIAEKNAQPTVTKQVQEDSTSAWGSSNTAGIGETVNFKSVIAEATNVTNVVFYDTMENGLDLVESSIVVTIGQTTLVADKDYTLSIGGENDSYTFKIAFVNYVITGTVTIEYSAVVNKNARIYSETNDNECYITYGDSQTTESSPCKTKTSVFEFTLAKVDDDNEELDNAVFTLTGTTHGEDAETVTYYFVKDSSGDYVVASASDKDASADITVGTAKIIGLDAGTYTLTETQAPDGYNALTESITVTIAEDGTVSVNEVATTNNTVTVENHAGATLPGTGGMGTTIFYVVGCIMMAGAAVLLITKKRMGKAD